LTLEGAPWTLRGVPARGCKSSYGDWRTRRERDSLVRFVWCDLEP
jgi:hypothetical protein